LAIFCVFRGIVEIQPQYEEELIEQATSLIAASDVDEKNEISQLILQAKPTLQHSIQIVVDQVLKKKTLTSAQIAILEQLEQAIDFQLTPMNHVDGLDATCRWTSTKLTREYVIIHIHMPASHASSSSPSLSNVDNLDGTVTKGPRVDIPCSSTISTILHQWYQYCHFLDYTQDTIRSRIHSHPIIQLTNLDLKRRIDALLEWELIPELYNEFEKLKDCVCAFFLLTSDTKKKY
jgi:hypothetical protein